MAHHQRHHGAGYRLPDHATRSDGVLPQATWPLFPEGSVFEVSPTLREKQQPCKISNFQRADWVGIVI